MTKITELPLASPLGDTEQLEIVQDGANKRIPASALRVAGKSAYELAVFNGSFTGTEQEFLVFIKGEPGPVGPQGIPGPIGLTGLDGAKGDKGAVGEQGIQGDKGATGSQGAIGERGLTGLDGQQGLKGDPGERGLQGPDGAQGADGNRAFTIRSVVTNYTLQLADSTSTLIRVTSDLPVNIIIPNDATADLPIGSAVLISRNGAGDVSVSPFVDVVIDTPDSYAIAKRYGKMTAIKTGPNHWEIEGNLAPA